MATLLKDYDRSQLDASLSPVMDALISAGFGDVPVTSGYRSVAQNKRAKGATRSQHIERKALDVRLGKLTPERKSAFLSTAVKYGVRGVGLYDNIGNVVHIDTRKNATTWRATHGPAVDWSQQSKWAQPALKSMFNAGPYQGEFPAAPAGPTAPETGPGLYGAMSVADLAQHYAAAGNRRAYEQGFRSTPAATPIDDVQRAPLGTTPADAYGQMALTMGLGGVPHIGLSPAMASMPDPSRFAPAIKTAPPEGTYEHPATALEAVNRLGTTAPTQPVAPSATDPARSRVGTGAFTAPDAARFGSSVTPTPTSFDPRYSGPQNVVGNTPMQGINMANASLLGPVLGGATLTPGMAGVAMKPATAPPSVTPTPTARPDYAPAAPKAAPAPTPAPVSAYPDEARFSMKPGLTPADMVKMGLTPAPAFTKPPTEVATPKVAAVQPVRERVVKTKTVAPAPAIAPAAPPPPSGFFATLQNAVEPMAAPFHTLANLAGPTPNPPTRNIGTGSAAISSVLSGQAQAGDTAYSRSMPGYSVKDLGNGMVEKTNQYGHKSYEHVNKPGGGIFSGQPTGGGFLSNFGLGGLNPTTGGLLSARNLGAVAGGLIGGLPGAVAGGFLGNMIGGGTGWGNTANVGPNAYGYAGPWGSGTAPASSGGGLFGGWGGGGTSSSVGGGKKDGGKSGGGGSTGMSHSTRF